MDGAPVAKTAYKMEKTLDGRAWHALVAGCFFLSGAAGLVYEVIWVRLIDKIIGSAPFAVATVLCVFMAGLALGSFAAGRIVDRQTQRRRLLTLYGTIEIGIGAFALLVPVMIRAVQPVFQVLYDPLLNHPWCYGMVSFACCVLILILPTALMGATLPVLSKFYVIRLEHIGTRTGWLYGLNTIGAALGVSLCGFVLIQHLGVAHSLTLFACINAGIGIFCIAASRFLAGDGPASAPFLMEEEQPRFPAAEVSVGPKEPMGLAVAIFAVSGFCSMAYEVLWTRLLGLIAGPTTYCFSLVVAAFIVGLALGSILFGRVADRTRNPMIWLAGTQMAGAVLALFVSHFLGNGQFFFAKLIYRFQDSFFHLLLMQSLVLFCLLMAPTLFWGAAFPLVNRLCVRSMGSMGRRMGTAYALNTLGALAGSFIAGFVLVPWVGKMNGLRLVILLQFCLSCGVLFYMGTFVRRSAGCRIAVAGVAGLGCLLISLYPNWRADLLSRGWYRDFDAIAPDLDTVGWAEAWTKGAGRIARHREGLDVVFQGEGASGFTTVERERTSLGSVEFAMFNSGKADASSHGDRSTQTLSAHIPMLFHPEAKKVMLLGLASGMTAGEILLYPVERLDVLEISRSVATACRTYFSDWNNHCLDDPRLRLLIRDGRNHLALTRQSYDVVISEPSNPWMAGLANVYTRQFFQLAKQRLTAHGFFAQWIQAYEMDAQTFSLLGRTFTSVFENACLIKVGPVDYLMLGFKDPTDRLDWDMADRHAGYAQKSALVRFPGTEFLVHLVICEDLKSLFGKGLLHTDNHPYLEFSAPKTLYRKRCGVDIGKSRRLSPGTMDFLTRHNDTAARMDLVAFAASANVPMFRNVLPWDSLLQEEKQRYREIVAGYCRQVLVPSYNIFDTPELKAACARLQERAIEEKITADETPLAMDHYNLALARIACGKKDLARQSLRRAIGVNPDHEAALTALGLLMAESESFDEAAQLLARAVELAPGKAAPHKYLGMVELQRRFPGRAIASLSTALRLSPEDEMIFSELGTAYYLQGDPAKAVAWLTRALAGNPRDAQSRYYLNLAMKKLKN